MPDPKAGDELAVIWIIHDGQAREWKATIVHHPIGPELRLFRNGEFMQSQVFRSKDALLEHARETRAQIEARARKDSQDPPDESDR